MRVYHAPPTGLAAATPERGSAQTARRVNRAIILGVLSNRHDISRAGLARLTGLSKSTVSSIVDDLIAEGFVRTTGLARGARGRRAEMLCFVSDARYVVGVELANSQAHAFLTDLDGAPVRRASIERPTSDPRQAVQLAIEVVQQVRGDLSADAILGIGVGTPGLVDPHRGVIETAPDLGWRDVPVGAVLAEHTGLPTLVSNRATAAAMGEYWRGAGQGAQSMVYVSVSTGVAAGLILGGALYRGVSMSEGQLGHVAIEPDGPLCACGSRGCLQIYASLSALLGEARARARGEPDSLLHGLCERDLSGLTLAQVGQAAAAEDAAALAVVARIGRYLGIGVAHLVSLLNPDVIVLGGAVVRAVPQVLRTVRREVDSRAFPVPAAAVSIVAAQLGADAVGVGAAALLIADWRRSELHTTPGRPPARLDKTPPGAYRGARTFSPSSELIQ